MGPLSYEGPEKYIFISYAHKDSEQVLKILEKLVEQGYRLWYDDGIAPGSEWPEDIATHLDGCALCMAFVSNNSMASPNCRREITFALGRHKPFLGVFLEKTEMSLGMEMQLSAQQCVLRYNFRKEEDFLRKICATPDLACCKIPEPEPVEEEVAPVPPPAPKPKPKPQPKPQPKSWKQLKKPLLIGGILGAVALVVGLICLISALNTVTILPGVDVSKNAGSVYLSGKHITADAVEKINSLEELGGLSIYNCTQDPGALEGLNLPGLRYVTVQDTQVSDFAFLEKSPELYSLTLVNCGVTDESFPAESLKGLTTLVVSGNPEFSELPQVSVESLQTVDVSGTAVSDVSCLADAVELSNFACANTQVADIEALAALENLKMLDCAGCPIGAVTEPFMSLSLRELNFTDCGLKTVEGFQNFTVLTQALLGGNELEQIEWLEKSAATLTELDLSGNPLDADDLEFVKNATALTWLDVSGLPLKDAGLVKNLTNLSYLRASSCGLEDISQMSGLTKLKELHLDNNRLADLTGLPAMAADTYSKLDLAYNQIVSIGPISGKFSVLALQGNPIQLSGNDFQNCSGTLLALDFDESMLTAGAIPFSRVYLTGCPADKQLSLQETADAVLEYLTPEEVRTKLEEQNFTYDYPIP